MYQGIAQDVLWAETPVEELPAEGAVRTIKEQRKDTSLHNSTQLWAEQGDRDL